MKTRKEYDSIGGINVPVDKYWGASTERSKKYFDIGEFKVRPVLIKSIAIIKKSAAIVHLKEKQIDKKIANAIIKASNDVIGGKLDDHFPLKVWQTGSGTQTNMNVNEVIANRAIHILGGKLGSKKPVHPNDHVNKSQSTNDVFPSAMHIAISIETRDKLLPSLNLLNKEIKKKVSQFSNIIKVGRTHLQDATPLTLGQEFSGYQSQVQDTITRIKNALKEINFLAQGGTAVGTGINTRKNFDKKICKEISKITKINFRPAKNKFASLAAHDAIVNFSGTLNTAAVCLMKIANDIRFLGSGPRAGYGELILPANEPGSSIMPGKVNPTQCEALSQVCMHLMGIHFSISIACSQGHFQLNANKTMLLFSLNRIITLLSDSIDSFNKRCLEGLDLNRKKIRENLENSLMLVTALNPKIGYEKSSKIAKKAFSEGISLKQAAIKLKYLKSSEFDQIVDPSKMIKTS